MNKKKQEVSPDDGAHIVPVKIRRDTLRLIKTLASWKDVTMAEYIHEVITEKAREAASKIADDFSGQG